MRRDDDSSNGPAAGRRSPHISKSKFLWGIQCPKLLWHAYNRNDLIPDPDAAQQAIFDQGHEVGELAKRLYPGGIEIAWGTREIDEVTARSRAALPSRQPLFEAGFAFNRGYARADILDPVGDGEWDIVEVKSGTEVKDVNLVDLAFQAFVYAGAGVRIRRCILMHIDGAFVRNGPIDPKRFFKQVDTTARVSVLARLIESQLDDMLATIGAQAHPDVRIGPRCSTPYPCPLLDHCWSFLPEGSVMDLYYGGRKGWRLLEEGILSIGEIPESVELTARQTIQRQVARTGQPHIDRPALSRFLGRLQYPVGYLDFETFGTAIPMFDGLSPYQQVPFQFSLHMQSSPDSRPMHRRFLADGRGDPRPEFLRRLRDSVGTEGTVLVYNEAFEKGVLDRLAEAFPDQGGWIEGVKDRMVDLLGPFKAFGYYHPDQQGSASIKAVLPALTGRSYAGLAIQEGDTASREYVRVHFGDVPEAERRQVRRQLERYCGLDTEGMVWIVEALRRHTE